MPFPPFVQNGRLGSERVVWICVDGFWFLVLVLGFRFFFSCSLIISQLVRAMYELFSELQCDPMQASPSHVSGPVVWSRP